MVTWAVASNAGALLSSRTLLKISATAYNRKLQTLLNTSNTLHIQFVCSIYILINAHFFSFIGFFPEQTIVHTKTTCEMHRQCENRQYTNWQLLALYIYWWSLYTLDKPHLRLSMSNSERVRTSHHQINYPSQPEITLYSLCHNFHKSDSCLQILRKN